MECSDVITDSNLLTEKGVSDVRLDICSKSVESKLLAVENIEFDDVHCTESGANVWVNVMQYVEDPSEQFGETLDRAWSSYSPISVDVILEKEAMVRLDESAIILGEECLNKSDNVDVHTDISVHGA